MGLDRVHFERRIYDPPPTRLVENWEHWFHRIGRRDREIAVAIHRAFHILFATHRTGYSQAVTEKLVLGALTTSQLRVQPRPIAKAMFHQKAVHESAIDCFVIEDRFVLTMTVHFDNVEFAKSLGLSHLKTLGLPWGIAANFGRTDLQITALRHK